MYLDQDPQIVLFEVMEFALQAHAKQTRKYTGAPYVDHLAEVAGIVATVAPKFPGYAGTMIAAAWLHDYIEDIKPDVGGHWGWYELQQRFGECVADGVLLLSDLEVGSRAARKAASRARLAAAPPWVQTIKCADLISNTSSIVLHDPVFAVTYLEEKRLLLDVLTQADPGLRKIAFALAHQPIRPAMQGATA